MLAETVVGRTQQRRRLADVFLVADDDLPHPTTVVGPSESVLKRDVAHVCLVDEDAEAVPDAQADVGNNRRPVAGRGRALE